MSQKPEAHECAMDGRHRGLTNCLLRLLLLVGADANGKPFTIESLLGTVNDLRAVGDRWAEVRR